MPAHRFTKTDDKLLQILARYVRATTEQCTRHPDTPATLSFVRKRLFALKAMGLVEAVKGFSRSTNPPLVYSPSLAGWRMMEEAYGLPIPKHWRPSETQLVSYRDYWHDLAITDFGITLEAFCKEAGELVQLEQFIHDRFLPQTKVTLPSGKSRAIRLDGFVRLRIRRGNHPKVRIRAGVLEIDRDTHYRKATEEKILAQLAYVRDGHYQADFQTKSLTYMWVSPGDHERITKLVKLTEQLLSEQQATDYAPLFLFTPADPAITDPLVFFTGQCWFTPFQTEPVNLLGFTPEVRPVQTGSHCLPREQYEQIMGDDSRIGAEMDAD